MKKEFVMVMDAPMSVAPGEETLHDYPGRHGLWDQLRAGLEVRNLVEKLDKAIAQSQAHDRELRKVVLQEEIRLTKLKREVIDENTLTRDLIRKRKAIRGY